MTYLEFFGTLTGGIAVWLSARRNIWSWPLGIVSVSLLFFLFFQKQLYPDMALQVFFCITNFMGWWRWLHPRDNEEDRKKELKVSYASRPQIILLSAASVAGTLLLGALASRLHEWLPTLFSLPSAFPYADSFVAVLSVVATYWMIQKKVECWIMWILVDMVATVIYFMKDLKLLGFEYLVFCFLAAFGLWNWIREQRSYSLAA